MFSTGALFSTDYLREAIKAESAYKAVDAGAMRARLVDIADAFPKNAKTNESQTEDDFIWPVLDALGWKDSLRQQNLTVTSRDDVPDGLLFADADAKAAANAQDDQWRRYGHGLAVVESKRWARPLDRASGRDETTAPSTQMLRFLRRIDDTSQGKLRWHPDQWNALASLLGRSPVDLRRVPGDRSWTRAEPRRHPLHLFDLPRRRA